MNDVAGTTQITVSGTSPGTSTGVRFCMYAKNLADVVCKAYPYRKVWTVSATNGVTSASVLENSDGFLKMNVGYRYTGSGMVSIVPSVKLAGQDLFEFSYPDQPFLKAGTGNAVISIRNIGQRGRRSDAIRLCLMEVDARFQIQGFDLAACQTVQLQKTW
jgi:hypothetical protein